MPEAYQAALTDKPAVPRLPQRASLVEWALVTLSLLIVVALLQIRDHAYSSEFEIMDDARHYVTCLAFLDYLRMSLANFSLSSPLGFLGSFHAHYPALGIGHWPPLFYVAGSLWMLLFHWSRISVLAFSAVILAALSGLTYGAVRNRFGRVAGAVAALVVAASPMHEVGRNTMMVDLPTALLCLIATWAYVRYLDTGRWPVSIAFALLATAAILLKGNGLCLALVPPFAILMARRFDLLARPSFWLPVPIVAILTAPWYLLTFSQEVSYGFIYPWGLRFTSIAIVQNTRMLIEACGLLMVVLALLGLGAVILAPRRSGADNGLIGAAALFAASITFQSVVPADLVARYLSPALAPLVILAFFGLKLCVGWLIGFMPQTRTLLPDPDRGLALGAALLGALFVPLAVKAHPKPNWGLIEAARTIWDHRIAANPSVLTALDPLQEPALIAELAMLDPQRPSLFVVSSVRLLVTGGLRPSDYVLRFETPEQVMAAIDRYAIPFAVVSSSARGKPHVSQLAQLDQVREAYPDRWVLEGRIEEPDSVILIYRITGNDGRQPDPATLLALNGPRGLRGDTQ